MFFSEETNEDLNRLFDFKKISAALKRNKTDFISHKNEILVLLVMVSRGEYYFHGFENGDQIINNWQQISKAANRLKNKKQVFLSPMLISSKGPKHHDKY